MCLAQGPQRSAGEARTCGTFVLVQGQINRNFQLLLNEIGPGWAWYFHSPADGSCQLFLKWNMSFAGVVFYFIFDSLRPINNLSDIFLFVFV